MAKSRNKKGSKGDAERGDTTLMDSEYLDEEHTIADSVTTFVSQVDDELADFDDTDNDELIASNAAADHRDQAAQAAAVRLARLQEAMGGLDEFATEKRTSRREATLRRLFRALTQFATGSTGYACVLDSLKYIRNACFHAIRTGQPAEQYAACRVLEATSVVLGADQDEWCQSLDRQLRRVVETVTRAIPVRMAALRALAMTIFIGASDSVTTESLMDMCELVAAEQYRNESVPAALRATGLDCWALLATTVDDFDLAGQDDVQIGRGLAMLESISSCLYEAGSMELRSAAGSCAALIHEARLNLGIAEEAGGNVTARQFQRGSWEGSKFEEVMDEIKQQIAELAVQSGHHLNKKLKKQVRATFREYTATVVEDEAPEEVVNFRSGSLTLTTWREIIQLNFCRHCLQSGFQIQLVTNNTLQAIFGVNGQALTDYGGMSTLEKRLIMSKTSEASKIADLKMAKNRTKRQNVKNHFLTVDGDDL